MTEATSAREPREAGALARLPRSGGILAMQADVPGGDGPDFTG